MIAEVIRWSIKNRLLVLILIAIVAYLGGLAVFRTPIEALPDLSDVQVIIKTPYPGQAPKVVEQQVTYPLSTAMLSVPGAASVRGYSFFGDSYVYVIFEDGTDIYWARARVLEYLNQVRGSLPADVSPILGPDATGVGWVYEYALIDRTGAHDLSQLRAIQDWFLKYELQSVPGVSEIATIGGMVKQYQVVVDPDRLSAFGITLPAVRQAIRAGNQESGGSVIEMAEGEYMVRASGYVSALSDVASIPLGVNERGTPVTLSEVADLRIGPQMRRGIAELNGEGEVVGGVVVMRFGENALNTINEVKSRLEELKQGLPDSVEIVETYDQSALIKRSLNTLRDTLIEESVIVMLVCALFLFHIRASLVVVFSLPIAILIAFGLMRLQGINANIMSLGGIAIAIGAMVDGAIVLVENCHRRLTLASATEGRLSSARHWELVAEASGELGKPVFIALVLITVSFLPVFVLEAQEGRLFTPLAFTKTYAMAGATVLSVFLVPILIGYLLRGSNFDSNRWNPINRTLQAIYSPVITFLLNRPWWVVVVTAVLLVVGFLPLTRMGSEFMPPLNEGDLMYMPTTYPSISTDKARELLQQTDRMIKTVPEVESVFGKVGRADSATDPAPLTMIETVIRLKPRDQWRDGTTMESLRRELNERVAVPGLNNSWTMPIKARIDMLATGIKTPIGIKISGPDLNVISNIGTEIENVLSNLQGLVSIYAERVAGGRYVEVDIDREQAARFGLSVSDVQDVIRTAVGGMDVTNTVEGLERYPINVRYPQKYRDSLTNLGLLPIVTPSSARIALADVASVRIEDGPPVIKSENGRPNGWVYIDIEGRDLGTTVAEARQLVSTVVDLPQGYSLKWSGQFEYLERAEAKLQMIIPLALAIVVFLLFVVFRNIGDVLLIIGVLPFSLLGGIGLLYLLDYNLSVAVAVGFIALFGVAAELCIVMVTYLNLAWRQQTERLRKEGREAQVTDLKEAVINGVRSRLRPIMMTTLTIVLGLTPIMYGMGTGSEVMRRIAAPMLGGMVSTLLLVLSSLPVIYYLWKRSSSLSQ